MPRLVSWLLTPVMRLFDGAWTSGAEACDYIARLRAVPETDAREERRAA